MRDDLCHDLSGEVLACISQEAANRTELAPAFGVWLMLGRRAERVGQAGNDVLRCRPLAYSLAGGGGWLR